MYVALEILQQNDTEQEGPVQHHSPPVETRELTGPSSLPEDVTLLPDLLLIGTGTHTSPVTD